MSQLKSSIRLIDTTLRDGSHAVSHQYSAQNITDICAGLEKGGVYAAEVGHGGGIGGSILEYGFAKETDKVMLSSARKVLKNTKLATLLVPGLGTMDDLRMAGGRGPGYRPRGGSLHGGDCRRAAHHAGQKAGPGDHLLLYDVPYDDA